MLFINYTVPDILFWQPKWTKIPRNQQQKIAGKFPNVNIQQHASRQHIEKISKRNYKYLKLNENKNSIYLNLQDAINIVLRKTYNTQCIFYKEGISYNNNLNFCHRKQRKKTNINLKQVEENKLKIEEVTKIENRRITEKSTKSKASHLKRTVKLMISNHTWVGGRRERENAN